MILLLTRNRLMPRLLLSLLLTLAPFKLSSDKNPQLILWNVGQGQWLTISTSSTCIHFDAGGEFMDFEAVVQECEGKQNKIAITHADWDHISFLRYIAKSRFNTCKIKADTPENFNSSFAKQVYLRLPLCDSTPDATSIKVSKKALSRHSKKKLFSRNDLSDIWTYKNKILIPGDSTRVAEKLWSKRLPETSAVLIVGHHGSNTSSSEELLKRFKDLKMALVSARRNVYGHPHPKVMMRFKKFKIPLLTTEDWGHIRVEL